MSFIVWPRPTTNAATCSLLALQTLYESSIAFGMRKALMTEQGKGEMETHITQLEGNVKDLERQVTTVPRWPPAAAASDWRMSFAVRANTRLLPHAGCECSNDCTDRGCRPPREGGLPHGTASATLSCFMLRVACACRLLSGSSSAR